MTLNHREMTEIKNSKDRDCSLRNQKGQVTLSGYSAGLPFVVLTKEDDSVCQRPVSIYRKKFLLFLLLA